jgi:hypothetical protein
MIPVTSNPGSKSILIRGTRRNFLRGGANNPLRRCSKVVSEMKRLSMPSVVEQLDIMDYFFYGLVSGW